MRLVKPELKDYRHEQREPNDRVVEWRIPKRHTLGDGWMLETSESGLAFVTRQSQVPTVGDWILLEDKLGGLHGICACGLVRRSAHVHGDLHLVAVERIRPTSPITARLAVPPEDDADHASTPSAEPVGVESTSNDRLPQIATA